jgi:hypothetical protein
MALAATAPCVAAKVGPVSIIYPGGPAKCLLF